MFMGINRNEKLNRIKLAHYPRLNTILKVEGVLEKNKGTMKKNEVYNSLNKSVKWVTLNIIFDYLEELGKIAEIKKGVFLWIWEDSLSKKTKKLFDNATKIR